MPKDYALRKLHSKEKIIFCGCDAIEVSIRYFITMIYDYNKNGNGLLMNQYLIRTSLRNGSSVNLRG